MFEKVAIVGICLLLPVPVPALAAPPRHAESTPGSPEPQSG